MNVEQLLEDHQIYHSRFQMDHLITGHASGTVYGMYVQALRELDARHSNLKELRASAELLVLDIEDIEATLRRPWHRGRRRRRTLIELRRKRDAQAALKRSTADTRREFDRFFAQAKALKRQIGELTPERRDELDREMWCHRLRCQLAVEVLTQGRPSANTVETITATPREFREALFNGLGNALAEPQKLLEWFERREPPAFEPPEGDESESPRTLEAE